MQEETTRKSLRERLLGWVKRRILSHIWYVNAPVTLLIRATPAVCLQTIATAAKPSAQRLHLRSVFSGGKRYFIQPRSGGFRMTSTRSVRWRYRRRTSSTAIMSGYFSPFGDDITRIQLHARMHIGYLLDTFLIPVLLAAIIFYTPWNPIVIFAAFGIVLTLSWIGHRANAILEANEMVWFIQKALDDLDPGQIMALGAGEDDVLHIHSDFENEWEKFYAEKRGDESQNDID